MSNSIPLSPFSERRREKEIPPTPLYINYSDYKSWITINNFVIEGTRGTGKTSILKSLNYETQWLKKTKIKPSIELQPIFKNEPDFVGVYLRCEEIEKSLWNRWLRKYERENGDASSSQILFATFLNYFFIEKIIQAITDITNNPVIDKNISELIQEVIQICYPSSNLKPTLYDFSLSSLKNVLDTTLYDFRRNIYSLTEFKIINEYFCLHTASSCIISKISKIITEKIDSFNDVKFFLLIDDVDRLDNWQIKVLNSFISSSEAPISLKITCTGEYNIKNNTNNRSISTTDLFISKLNDEENPINKKVDSTIDELFSAIFQFRLESRGIDKVFPFESIFSKSIDIEEVFVKTLKTSTNPKVKSLLEDFAQNNNYYSRLSDFWIDNNNIDARYSKIKIKEEGLDEDNINHKYYNKYRISAIFSAIHQFELQDSFTYYSFDVIKMLSSGSPRHFLRICDKLWETIYSYYTNSPNASPIEFDLQNQAIRNAASDVLANIETDEFDGKINVSCNTMCKRIGSLMKEFLNIDSLKVSPECLSILIDINKLNNSEKIIFSNIIDRLRMYEAIKTKEIEKTNKILIALSPILAPIFVLPYRSPFSYYYTMPSSSLFLKLLTTDDNEAKNIIKQIYNDRIQRDSNPKLFGND